MLNSNILVYGEWTKLQFNETVIVSTVIEKYPGTSNNRDTWESAMPPPPTNPPPTKNNKTKYNITKMQTLKYLLQLVKIYF